VAHGYKVGAEQHAHSKVVGGLAHHGRYGMAGMDFVVRRRGGNELRARKSYTVLDDGVLLLGSGVRLGPAGLPGDHHVRTILHQCPLRKGDQTATVDGRQVPLEDGTQEIEVKRWMHVRNYGYWFPEPATVTLRVWTSTQTYQYINSRYHTPTKYTRRFYTLSIDHGRQPENGGYTVMILPTMPADETRGFAEKPGVAVVERSGKAHAIRVARHRLTACYFFEPAEAAGVTVDRPLFVAASPDGDALSVSVQDPVHKGGRVRLGLPGDRPTEVAIEAGMPTTFRVEE
jgi:hyaluronate lyase